jgi:hypothetical protein
MKRGLLFLFLATVCIFSSLALASNAMAAESVAVVEPAVASEDMVVEPAVATLSVMVVEPAVVTEEVVMVVEPAVATSSVMVITPAVAISPMVVAEPVEKGPKKIWDTPLLNLPCSLVETAWTIVWTPFAGSTEMIDRINPGKWVGNGFGNGLQRIYEPFAGIERDFGEKGYIAKNKIVSEAAGWAGLLYGLSFVKAAHVAHHFTHHVLGMARHDAALMVGGVGGAAVGGIETAMSGSVTDK